MENTISSKLSKENELMKRLVNTLEFKIMALELIKDKLIIILNNCKCNQMSVERQEVKELVQKYDHLKQENDNQLKRELDKNNESLVNTIVDNHFDNNNQFKPKIDDKSKVNKLVTKSKQKVLASTDRFPCSWPGCDLKFSAKYLLKSHLLSHTGEKPFLCDWPGCDKRYYSKGNLNHHKDQHYENKRFKCSWPGCDERFIRKEVLDKHICDAHTGKMPYICDWPGCEYQSCYGHKLRNHRRRHTQERPYKCDWPQCEWSFVEQHKLNEHMLKHTGERRYACEWPACERKFKSRRAMKFHMEKTHQH